MSLRANPDFLLELKKYGDINIESCFNCGNCTAICPLSSDNTPFPRNMIRRVQLGLKDEILSLPDPWLCYYCGECTETCPRQAEPAEAQMAMRRWLTAQYDWTGLAKKFYTSKLWEIGSLILVSGLVLLLVILLHGPIITDHVELNTFAPVHLVEVADWIMLGGLSFFLLSNVARMFYFILLKGNTLNIPVSLYITELWKLIYNAATQARFLECEDEPNKNIWKKFQWRNHFILVAGYITMFILIVVFLKWFQTDNIYPIWHPQRWIGYLAAIALFFGSIYAIWGRIKKDKIMHQYSHLSDWIFPILLFLTTLTGLFVNIFRYLNLPLATYYTYVLHLMILTPMLVLEVPFGKWSHLAYRPLAIYFEAIREKAKEIKETPADAFAPAD